MTKVGPWWREPGALPLAGRAGGGPAQAAYVGRCHDDCFYVTAIVCPWESDGLVPKPQQDLRPGALLGPAPGGRLSSWLPGQGCEGQSPAPSCGFPRVSVIFRESSTLASGAHRQFIPEDRASGDTCAVSRRAWGICGSLAGAVGCQHPKAAIRGGG